MPASFPRLCVVLAVVYVAGCAATAPMRSSDGTGMQSTSFGQINKLYAKATERPPVHRFRKPVRDERRRVQRQLAAACERMVAKLSGQKSEEAVLTSATDGAPSTNARVRLRDVLQDLSAAARQGDEGAMRRAHEAARRAYAQHRPRTMQPAP